MLPTLAPPQPKRAALLAPGDARCAQAVGLERHLAWRTRKALQALRRAVQRWPTGHDLLLAPSRVPRAAGPGVASRPSVQQLLMACSSERDGRALDRALG